jgi:hypothetical protein
MAEITRWQLKCRAIDIVKSGFVSPPTVDPRFIWKEKDKEGQSEWDRLQEIASEGWELVSVTPIHTAPDNNQTFTLLYTFKRPLP